VAGAKISTMYYRLIKKTASTDVWRRAADDVTVLSGDVTRHRALHTDTTPASLSIYR